MRRSIFPLGEPGKKKFSRLDKGKDGQSGLSLDGDADAIELMPHSRRMSDGRPESDPETMVIRKEVEYSVQYEYDEARQMGEGASKRVSTVSNDAMAYV